LPSSQRRRARDSQEGAYNLRVEHHPIESESVGRNTRSPSTVTRAKPIPPGVPCRLLQSRCAAPVFAETNRRTRLPGARE
jgi:hypothetical protein